MAYSTPMGSEKCIQNLTSIKHSYFPAASLAVFCTSLVLVSMPIHCQYYKQVSIKVVPVRSQPLSLLSK
jgi:hypothetical protein